MKEKQVTERLNLTLTVAATTCNFSVSTSLLASDANWCSDSPLFKAANAVWPLATPDLISNSLFLVYCTSGTPSSLALLEHAKYTPVFASAVSSAEFLFSGLTFLAYLAFLRKPFPDPITRVAHRFLCCLKWRRNSNKITQIIHSSIQQISS